MTQARHGDVVGAGNRWIPQDEYDSIQARVPILCVDALLLSRARPSRIGLVRRDTYGGGEGWCLVGGAVLRDEPLAIAVERHVRATATGLILEMSTLALLDVIEYFTTPRLGEFHDPRKHAVALTYGLTCSGNPRPQGEALEFRWFQREELSTLDFGFGHGRVVARVLQRLIGDNALDAQI